MNCYEHTLIIKQEVPSNQTKVLINKYQDIINKIQTKVDILKISIDKILIGDLIYDGYLIYSMDDPLVRFVTFS